jgi:acyl dehydratase
MEQAPHEREAGRYQVLDRNSANASENKIHDDEVARRFGFKGGLVPGVDVYAYMMHLPVRRWGLAWLERGQADCRFLKPVYDGAVAVVIARKMAEGLALEVMSRGELCAAADVSLPATSPPVPAPREFARVRPPESRPPADEQSLAVGISLGMRPLVITRELLEQYLHNFGENEPIYASEGLAHPGLILRTCNWTLSQSVALGPWIHVGSAVKNYAVVRVGDAVSVRARVTANYQRKGHQFVELEALVLVGWERPVARVAHTAIYRPRQAEV